MIGSRINTILGRARAGPGSAADAQRLEPTRGEPAEPPATWRRALKIVRSLLPFARRGRRWFYRGCLAALCVVAARLALPWPLRAVAEGWGPADPQAGELLGSAYDPVHYVFGMGALFLLCILVLGLFDWLERLYFARFAIGTVQDMRAKAFWSAIGGRARDRSEGEERASDDDALGDDLPEQDDGRGASSPAGDLVARLVGDTARVKNGLQGFLVHVATNGVLLIGVTVVLFIMNVDLGLIFAAASGATMVVTLLAAGRMFQRSLRQRSKEGELAGQIQQALDREPGDARFVKINKSSGIHEAAQTQIQGLASFFAHLFFGLAVLAALWVGAGEVEAGRAATGDILVMMMYVLLLRGPFVRLARQGARTGKILGAASRLEQVLTKQPEGTSASAEIYLMPLRDSIQLRGIGLPNDDAGSGGQSGSVDVALKAGERIAVVGSREADRTAFLEVISGALRPATGSVLWDGADLSGTGAEARAVQIAYLPKCSERGLTQAERPMSEFVRLIHRQACVWLFEDPTRHMPENAADDLLDALLATTGSTMVIVATSRPADVDRFDRVIELQGGSVVFDGAPLNWPSRETGSSHSRRRPETMPRADNAWGGASKRFIAAGRG